MTPHETGSTTTPSTGGGGDAVCGGRARVQAYRLHRAWHYGLNYYLDRELPEWDERGGPSLVVTNADGVRTLKSLDVPVKILDDVSVEAVLVRVPAPSAGRATPRGQTRR